MRHAVRLWGRQPALALAAVVSLALGIGANTAIFSVMQAVVVRPLPYPDADRIVVVWETRADAPARWVAPANYLDWRRETRSFESLAAVDDVSLTLTGRGEPERLRGASASGTFFTTLGVQAAAGRTLLPADDDAGAPPVAVLTDGLATRLFGEPRAALGRELHLDGQTRAIVGVLPAGFAFALMPEAELWISGERGIPRSFPFPGDITTVRDSHVLTVIGRLRVGVTPEVARQDVAGVMDRLARAYPETNEGLGAGVTGLHDEVTGRIRPMVVLLQLAVALMLAIACANVASLLLGQAARREAELTTRVALGAGRGRLVGQLLTETLVIAIPGGALGLLAALWGLDALVALAPAELPRRDEIAIDPSVLGFTLALTLGTAVACGLGPAVGAARRSAGARSPAHRVAGDRRVHRWHRVLAIGELAIAQVLLVAAGVLVASFMAAQRVDLGYVPDGRLAADLSLAPERYLRPAPDTRAEEGRVDIEPRRQLVDGVLERLRSAPGVRAAAASFTAPMAGAPNRGIWLDDTPVQPSSQGPSADFQAVTPDYFRALGITLARGRDFDDRDDRRRPAVAIVNQAFVDRFMAGRDPLGRVLAFGGSRRHEIVGVVANARYRRVEEPAAPTFYVPLLQNDERWPFLSFTVWLDDDATTGHIASLIRARVRDLDPAQPIARVRTYDEALATALAPRRFNALLVGLFAAMALLLAAVGAYGIMAFGVVTRGRELGVRAALGASPSDLRRLVLAQGAWVGTVAVVLGLAAGQFATRGMAALLYEARLPDPVTYAVVAALLGGVALMATWLPARDATRVDPMRALREP